MSKEQEMFILFLKRLEFGLLPLLCGIKKNAAEHFQQRFSLSLFHLDSLDLLTDFVELLLARHVRDADHVEADVAAGGF